MSDITGTPPAPPSQPSGGQKTGPERVADARSKQEQTTTDHGADKHERPAAQKPIPGARFEPPVAVAPSLLHLAPGDEIRGEISRVDAESRPILETRTGSFALEPDAGLKARDQVLIRVLEIDRKAIGELLEKGSTPLKTPVRVTLTLLALHQNPEAGPVVEAGGKGVAQPLAYHPDRPRLIAPESGPDLQASLLALTRAGALVPQGRVGAPPSAETQIPGRGPPSSNAGLVSILAASTPGSQTDGSAAKTIGATPSTQAGSIGGAAIIIPKPGTKLSGRLVTAVQGENAAPQIATLKPGAVVTLEVLGAGAIAGGGTAHGLILQGKIVSPEVAAQPTGAATAFSPESSPPQGSPAAGAIPASETGLASPTATPARQGSVENVPPGAPNAPNSQLHYLQTPAGSFVFQARGTIPLGTPLIVGLTSNSGVAGKSGQAAIGSPAVQTEINDPEAVARSLAEGLKQSQASPDAARSDLPAGNAKTPLPLPPLPPLGVYPATWPVIDEVLAAAAEVDPMARGIISARLPAPDARFPNTFLFFLTALGVKQPANWFGERASRALENWRNGGLFKRLREEFARLGRISRDIPGTDWRPMLVPMQHDSGTHAIVVLTRPHHEGEQRGRKRNPEDDNAPLPEKQRFLLEIRLSRLGRLQLDGLMGPGRLDLVLRAGDTVGADMQSDLKALYAEALEREGIVGTLGFEPLSRSPVDIQDILAKALPEDHAQVTA